MSAADQIELDLEPVGEGFEPAPASVRGTPWLVGMNDEQAAVIAHTHGPLAVDAGAGSGKTRALVNRIARLVADGVDPIRILAVTFSKKGKDEMNVRLSRDLGVREARVGTWHSLAIQILKEDGHPCAQWEIGDERNRHKTHLKEALGYKHLDWKLGDVTKVGAYVGICKARMWLPESPEAMAEAVARFGRDARLARDAYSISDGLTHAAGILTFDDMLLFCARHLAVPENAEKWSARWDFVLQDEAQDASPVQNAIARALASGHRNYMIVGDFFQSIYGFRGSDPRLFAAFPAEWNAEVVHMKRNYRSAAVIVEAANLAILGAAERPAVAEPMTAMRPDEGAARALEAEDHDDEAGEFVTYIRARHAQSGKWSDCTALFRTNAQSRALEDALLRERIPYEVVGGVSFYERKEVKDLLAYLRVALGRDRDGDAVRRCINAPFRFLGKAFVDRLMQLARAAEHPVDWPRLVDAAAQQAGIQGRQRESAREWCRLVARVAAANERHEDAGRILVDLIQQTAFIAWLSKDEGEESVENSAAANVRELARVAASFKSADELLDYVEQNVRDRAKQKKASGDRVLLMSVHKSKGLEWPCVWVVGCNDGVLPHAKGDVEEERRLFYVACTRARDELTCSYVSRMALPRGVVEVGPSAFLRDAGLI